MEPGGREWKTVEAVELSPYDDFHKLLCNLFIAIYISSSFLLLATRYDRHYHCFKFQVQLIATEYAAPLPPLFFVFSFPIDRLTYNLFSSPSDPSVRLRSRYILRRIERVPGERERRKV
jgi:hypothetical protein